jgi:hypothetical protein
MSSRRKGGKGATGNRNSNQNRVLPESIVVHGHDVLNGRGVIISQHPGNERFRALIRSRSDPNYCSEYTTSQKDAVALDIIAHIQKLNPPGRFLFWQERTRGSEAKWAVLSPDKILDKTKNAVRDCNRSDRNNYAEGVNTPEDVLQSIEQRRMSGLSNHQIAEQHASTKAPASTGKGSRKRSTSAIVMESPRVADTYPVVMQSSVAASAPIMESSLTDDWMPRKRRANSLATPNHNSTPATAASSGGSFLPEPPQFPTDLNMEYELRFADSPSREGAIQRFDDRMSLSPPQATLDTLYGENLTYEDDYKPPAPLQLDDEEDDDEESPFVSLTDATVYDGDHLSNTDF